ncbi:MAG: DUF4271 domain-containing protein [Bacteroidetes bacterium]|nr:DUF4271 domain-containing protein [Bacteroidota bacterium]
MQSRLLTLLLIFGLCMFVPKCWGNLHTVAAKYSLTLSAEDSVRVEMASKDAVDSLLRRSIFEKCQPEFQTRRKQSDTNLTPDFYLLLSLVIVLGWLRFKNSRYFSIFFESFWTGSSKQNREILQSSVLPNFILNTFYCGVLTVFIYNFVLAEPSISSSYPKLVVLLLFFAFISGIYVGKYFLLKFIGWAFGQQEFVEEYIHQVFLVGKMTGILLLPIVIISVLIGSEWRVPIMIGSFVLLGLLLLSRYYRSWSAIQKQVRGASFHIFTYLCASEILTIAVLIKWMIHLIG